MPSATLGYKPTLDSFSQSIKGQDLEASITSLSRLLHRRQIVGPQPCAIATANLLSRAVSKSKAGDFDGLRIEIAQIGARLVKAQPKEPVIANITRRVLGLISDEAEEDRNGDDTDTIPDATPADMPVAREHTANMPNPPLPRPMVLKSMSSFSVAKTKSLLHLFSAESFEEALSGTSTPVGGSFSANMHGLRTEVVDGIEEIKDEIAQVDSQISAKADHISPGETILVCRPSATVRSFLAKAAARRNFTVFVLFQSTRQNPEDYSGFKNDLARHGVEVVNLYGSAATVMTRLTRVVLDGRAVFADGSVLLDTGCGTVAAAAKRHGKTVTILSGAYKFSPEIPDDSMEFVQWDDASGMGGFADEDAMGIPTVVPVTEVIPEPLVDEYITNLGVHASTSIPNIVLEHYKLEDLDFAEWAFQIAGGRMAST